MTNKPKVKGIRYAFAKKGVSRKEAKEMINNPNMEVVKETLQRDKTWDKVAPTEKETTTLNMGSGSELYSGEVFDKFKTERLAREKKLKKTIAKIEENKKNSQRKSPEISATMKAIYKDRRDSGDQSTSTCMVGEDPKCKKGADVSYKSGDKNYMYKTSKKNLNQDIRYIRRGTASDASPREQALKDRTLSKRDTYATRREINSQKAFGYAMKRLERTNAKKK
jgi:hypothetical protein